MTEEYLSNVNANDYDYVVISDSFDPDSEERNFEAIFVSKQELDLLFNTNDIKDNSIVIKIDEWFRVSKKTVTTTEMIKIKKLDPVENNSLKV